MAARRVLAARDMAAEPRRAAALDRTILPKFFSGVIYAS
jgi:hypothetical protein